LKAHDLEKYQGIYLHDHLGTYSKIHLDTNESFQDLCEKKIGTELFFPPKPIDRTFHFSYPALDLTDR
jgi:hypothetical protein